MSSFGNSGKPGRLALIVGFVLLAAACGSGAEEDAIGSQESNPGATSESSSSESSDPESSDPVSSDPESSDPVSSDPESGGDSGMETDDDGADSGDGPTDGTAEADATSDRAEAEGYALAFSTCMRDQGVDLPDLEITADGSLDVSALVQNVDTQDPAVQRALLACQDSLGGKLEGALAQFLTSETFDDTLIGFSDCVRDGGYAVKDLTLEAIVGAMFGAGPGPDPLGLDGSFAPIVANALGLDPGDPEVISTIDGCAAGVQAGLADLDLGALLGDS